jgi:uncharacterized protein
MDDPELMHSPDDDVTDENVGFHASRDVPDADDAAMLIEQLGLVPHPEGGFYRETYRSAETIPGDALPERYTGDRALATAIYYLLNADGCSRFHRVASDEVFHFYRGDPVLLVVLYPDGDGDTIVLGPDILAGQVPQAVVPSGCWQGLVLRDGGGYALLGATVSPGFDFSDFDMGDRTRLIDAYPAYRTEISLLTSPE